MSKDPKLTAAIAFYGMIFQAQQKTQVDSCMYQRFIKVPSILSITLRYTLMFAVIMLWCIRLPDMHLIALLLASAAIGMVALIVGVLCSNYALSLAVGERINNWLASKCDSHDKKGKWIKAVHPLEMEFAASLPDEAWEVDEENGGIKILEGHEHLLNQFRIAK